MSQQVEIKTPGGSKFYVSRKKAERMSERKEATFISRFVMIQGEPLQNYADFSQQKGPRFQWKPWPSGGDLCVLQMR